MSEEVPRKNNKTTASRLREAELRNSGDNLQQGQIDRLVRQLLELPVASSFKVEELAGRLSSTGSAAVPKILQALRQGKAFGSGEWGLVEALRIIGDKSALPLLKEIAANKRRLSFVRASAQQAIREMEEGDTDQKRFNYYIKKLKGYVKNLEPVKNRSKSDDLGKAQDTIFAFVKLKDQRAIQYIQEAAEVIPELKYASDAVTLYLKDGPDALLDAYHKKPDLQNFIMRILGEELRHPYGIPLMLQRLQSPDHWVHEIALYYAKNDFPIRDVIPYALDILKHDRTISPLHNCKWVAIEVLGKIATPEDRDVIEALNEYIDSKRWIKHPWKLWLLSSGLDIQYAEEALERISRRGGKKIETEEIIDHFDSPSEISACASEYAKKEKLTFNNEGVRILEERIKNKKRVKPKTMIKMGAFLGETIVKALDGKWIIDDTYGETWAVDLPSGAIAYPFDKIKKRLLEGEPHDLDYYFTELQRMD